MTADVSPANAVTTLTTIQKRNLRAVWLDRSENAGRPRLHIQKNINDNPLFNIRLPPRLTKGNLLALHPILVETMAQVKQMLRDRLGYSWSPEDGPYLDFTPEYTPDFTTRLEQLDVPTLRLAGAEMEGAYWGALALNLIQTVFPAEYESLTLDLFDGWWEIFSYFYKLVSWADWFPIHWELLNHLWEGWMEIEGNPLYLTRYLDEIPIQVFGIGLQEYDEFPVLRILHGLLVDPLEHLDESDLPGLGFNISRDEINPTALGSKLLRADLKHLPPPLNHLAKTALVVIGGTGNPFLDTWFDHDMLTTSEETFCWATDIPRLRKAWQSAEPIATSFTAFLDWFITSTYDTTWPPFFSEADKIRAMVDTIIN